jgi:hypothetical protein
VTTDVGEEELQAVRSAAHRSCVVRRDGGGRLGLLGRLADLEPDRLELAGQLLHLLFSEVVLERERLELGRLDEPALLGALDQQARLIAFKQLVHLILRQVSLVVLSPSSRTDTDPANLLKLSHRNRIVLASPSLQGTTIPLADCEERNAWL